MNLWENEENKFIKKFYKKKIFFQIFFLKKSQIYEKKFDNFMEKTSWFWEVASAAPPWLVQYILYRQHQNSFRGDGFPEVASPAATQNHLQTSKTDQ